ncbi:MAG: DUF3352 domain-containing protein [Bacteroidales bacterium]|jgi:hypothetical protein|nr:DUF3352 domain-containing protein [Bacteroidales bacterium]MDN5350114.1 hypothetical protein [Bacteroidales bacterium]
MHKGKLTYFIGGIVLVLGIVFLVYFMQQSQQDQSDAWLAVPEDAMLVMEWPEPGMLWNKLTAQTSFWPLLKKVDAIARIEQNLQWVDSLFSDNQEFKTFISKQKILLSLHRQDESFSFLFVAEVGNKLKMNQIRSALQSKFSGKIELVERGQQNFESTLLVDAIEGRQYAFAIENGLLIGSFDKALIDKALLTIKKEEAINKKPALRKLENTKGQAAEAYVYLNYAFLSELISTNAADTYAKEVKDFVSELASWSALDLLLKEQDVLLNGYALADSGNYLYHLRGLNAGISTVYNVLPFSSRILLTLNIEDFQTFWERTANSAVISDFEKSFGLNIREELLPALSGELGLVYTGISNQPVFVARLEQEQLAERFMSRLGKVAGGTNSRKVENAVIHQLNPTGFTGKIFGKVFGKPAGRYYLITDQYLLVADDSSLLEEVLHLYRSGRTLDMNNNFKRFRQNMSDQANISLYLNLRDGLPLLESFGSNQLRYQLNRNQQVFGEFEAIAVQFTSFNELVYQSMTLKHNPNYKEESLVAWKTELEYPIIGKPHIVEDHVTSKYNLIVFDAKNQLYLINPDGKVMWKKQLSETPISEVFVVDYYKNGKFQFLFNTANYLHLIDRNGNNVAGYPVKLRSQATNGIAVFDYNNRKDYRILVSCADKLTYNYELNGSQVDGWQKPRSLEIVTKQVERLIAAGKDYIIITDIKGNVRIVDRRGNVRISPRGKLEKSVHADFYLNKTNSKGILLTSDKQGKLLYVSSSGQLSTTDFGQFGSDHFFLYEDFNQDGNIDFIYLDGDELQIFDRFKKDLFRFKFKNTIVTKPRFFNITKRKRLLGIVSEASREIYLIDKNGKMIISSGLTGETPFAVGSLHDSDEINLVTGVGNMVYNYVIY